MKAKYFKKRQKVEDEVIQEIANGIIDGKNVVFPTETVYGVGANAWNTKACKSVFLAKERPGNKPLIVLVSNLEMMEDIASITCEVERKLIEKFWPGPLTIILKKKENSKISEIVTAGKNNVGVRMTSGTIAQLLIQKAGVPIVAPSANLSGKPTGIKIQSIIQELGDKVDYILDCGDIQHSTTSTVVQVKDNVIYVLRQGMITIEQLNCIADVKVI